MTKTAKTVIIGLDGVPFSMLKDFTESGVMPHTSRIIKEGFFSPIRSAIPEISCVAWSSIITGVNPAEHGIFGFVDLQPGSYKMRFPSYDDLKALPFWESAKNKSIIINVPSTYPVRQMNGVHISGFVSIDFERSIYPQSLIPELQSINYHLDVDSQQAHKSMDMFLRDVEKTLDSRIQAYRYLWENQEWQNFMFVFTETDRLMHFLWNAYEDASHKYHKFFLDHFKKVDEVIGEIYSRLTGDDFLILLSDHGFERLDKEVYINYLLADKGLLKLSKFTPPAQLNIDRGTKAFAMDPGRIYINRKNKYPQGDVERQDVETLVKQLENIFASLQIDGKKVIRYIFRKQDVYSGPYLENAPDLILIAEKGFNLKGAITAKELSGRGVFTGKHTYEDAFVLIKNKEFSAGFSGKSSVIDVGKLIKSQAVKELNIKYE